MVPMMFPKVKFLEISLLIIIEWTFLNVPKSLYDQPYSNNNSPKISRKSSNFSNGSLSDTKLTNEITLHELQLEIPDDLTEGKK